MRIFSLQIKKYMKKSCETKKVPWYLPLNVPNIRPHYPRYKVVFHFVLASLKIQTLPVKLQTKPFIKYWNVIWTKSGWQRYDKLCEKIFQHTNRTHIFTLGTVTKSLKSAKTFPGEWNVQLNQSCSPTCLIILRKALNYISLLIKISFLFGHVTYLAHFWPRYRTFDAKNFTFRVRNKAFHSNSTHQYMGTTLENEFRSKVNNEYVFDLYRN